MEEKTYRKRRGSLVFPLFLIVLGVLFLLDNLNVTSGIDWGTLWKLWPVILIALGLEVMLGRRVSFGAVLLLLIVVVIGGAAVWWSLIGGTGEGKTEFFTWSAEGIERAELELELGVGILRLDSESDMGALLRADLELAPGVDVSERVEVDDDVARGWITSDRSFFSLPQIFGGKDTEWDLELNERVRWEIDVNTGVGEAWLDLSDLRVSDFRLDSGVGTVHVTLPERGMVEARVDGGVGDLHITIPDGAEARFQVDRGIGDLTVGSRFKRQGDYYVTEGLSDAESYIDLQIEIGVGAVTVR